jgi:hypothetical protein
LVAAVTTADSRRKAFVSMTEKRFSSSGLQRAQPDLELTHMTKDEQHRMVNDLKDYLSKMERQDQYDFEMFVKRDKDDEELDSLSFRKLEEMHKRYVVRKTKKDIEEMLKKYSADLKKGKGSI